jgi:hypothetical protein
MSYSTMTPCQIAAAAIDSFVALLAKGHTVRDAHELAIAAALDQVEEAELRADAAAEDAATWGDTCPF